MKIFFDTEFIDTGREIYPISIGMVTLAGEEYYAEVDDVPWDLAHPWVMENVHSKLLGGECVKSRDEIAREISFFVGRNPEFWAYVACYDWMLLVQLYGRLLDTPRGWPMVCHDLKLYAHYFHLNIYPNADNDAHNALVDAHWNRQTYGDLMRQKAAR